MQAILQKMTFLNFVVSMIFSCELSATVVNRLVNEKAVNIITCYTTKTYTNTTTTVFHSFICFVVTCKIDLW